jgi:arylsulfate sulfotransferase
VLRETCVVAATCPPFTLAKEANDWTHGNSIAQTPDGNLLYSSRHQDWAIKISYDNGEGDGHVIWKLGKDGDFTFPSSDPYPWFSHQHDVDFDPDDPTKLLVFDNGNTRYILQNQGYSRGQVLQLDEPNRTATLVVNADVGVYSLALGTAQKLSDGNYHFDFGYVLDPEGPDAYAIEVDPSGNVLYQAKSSAPLYRSFRMTDMYTPQ